MNETSIIAIILSLFAVGGTLGGVWLGHLLERNNESRKWQREHTIEVITEVFNSCQNVAFEADKIYYNIECGGLEHYKQSEVVFDKISEMDRTLHKAVLLLSQDVYQKVFDLVDHCGKEIGTKSVMCPKLPQSEWSKIRTKDFASLSIICIMAARNDLEIYPKLYSIAGLDLINKSINEVDEELSKGNINTDKTKQRIQEIKKEIEEQKGR